MATTTTFMNILMNVPESRTEMAQVKTPDSFWGLQRKAMCVQPDFE